MVPGSSPGVGTNSPPDCAQKEPQVLYRAEGRLEAAQPRMPRRGATSCRIAARPLARYHPPFLLEGTVGWLNYADFMWSSWRKSFRQADFYGVEGALVRRCRKRMKNQNAKTIPVWIMADVCISSRRSLKRVVHELAEMVLW